MNFPTQRWKTAAFLFIFFTYPPLFHPQRHTQSTHTALCDKTRTIQLKQNNKNIGSVTL